jgi:hypothetical protein
MYHPWRFFHATFNRTRYSAQNLVTGASVLAQSQYGLLVCKHFDIKRNQLHRMSDIQSEKWIN